MQRKYCLRPLTPNNELVLECTPNSNEAVATSNQEKATTWFYSDNNLSSDRDRLLRIPLDREQRFHGNVNADSK